MSLKSLLKIGDNVVNVFGSNRKPDSIGLYSLFQKFIA
jgi:hypothetical protein